MLMLQPQSARTGGPWLFWRLVWREHEIKGRCALYCTALVRATSTLTRFPYARLMAPGCSMAPTTTGRQEPPVVRLLQTCSASATVSHVSADSGMRCSQPSLHVFVNSKYPAPRRPARSAATAPSLPLHSCSGTLEAPSTRWLRWTSLWQAQTAKCCACGCPR